MLRNNNSEIDIAELNKRINDQVEQYKLSPKRLAVTSSKRRSVSRSLKATTIAELMGRDDRMFVEQAYELILGREVDADGLGHYLGQLRQGGEKTEIITALCCSTEGQKNAHLFTPASRYRFKSRLSRLPVFGVVFSHFFALITVRPFRRYVNSRFNSIAVQADDHSVRVNDLEQQVEVLVQYQMAQRKQWDLFSGSMQVQVEAQQRQIETMEQVIRRLEQAES